LKLPIPSAVFDQHAIILGKTRSGKSSKMRVCVEWLLRNKKRVVILSPKDDWWGLRLEGPYHAGFPVVIFGGAHADVPFSPSAGGAIAQLVCSGNRPAIITLARIAPTARTRFYIEFMEALFKHHQGELYVVIDEVHNFAPKGKVFSPEAGMMLHWSNVLAAEGQGQGLIMLAASQRPQKVHNDLLTSCETLIACRVIHKADRDAVKDWIDGAADPDIGKQVLSELASMERSEAWCWSPEIGFGPQRVVWPMFSTFDSFKPQGSNPKRLRGWASVDLDAVKTQLADAVAEAEANDPKVLKNEIHRLTAELVKERQKTAGPEVGPARLHDAFQRGQHDAFERGHKTGVEFAHTSLRKHIHDAGALIDKELSRLAILTGELPSKMPHYSNELIHGKLDARLQRDVAKAAKVVAKEPAKFTGNAAGDTSIRPGEAKILTLAIQYGGSVMPETVSVSAGLKQSSRNEYVSRLIKKGYMVRENGAYAITGAGRAAMPNVEPLPTGKALQEYWKERLRPGEWKLLHCLLHYAPDWVDTDDMERDVPELKQSSRNEYLSRWHRRC
jgi:hypothetical protein